MSAFIKFENKVLKFGRNVIDNDRAIINSTTIKTESIILNILGLSTKIENPIKRKMAFTFWDIFISRGYRGDIDYSNLLRNPEEDISNKWEFKTFPEIMEMFDKYLEVFEESGFNVTVDRIHFDIIANNITNYIKKDYDALHKEIITIEDWMLPVEYSNVVGGSDMNSIMLIFPTERDAINSRDRIMLEIEEFYINFASYVKFMVLK